MSAYHCEQLSYIMHARKSSDNIPSYPPDDHHCLDLFHWRRGECSRTWRSGQADAKREVFLYYFVEIASCAEPDELCFQWVNWNQRAWNLRKLDSTKMPCDTHMLQELLRFCTIYAVRNAGNPTTTLKYGLTTNSVIYPMKERRRRRRNHRAKI